jgi:hypothetical protein
VAVAVDAVPDDPGQRPAHQHRDEERQPEHRAGEQAGQVEAAGLAGAGGDEGGHADTEEAGDGGLQRLLAGHAVGEHGHPGHDRGDQGRAQGAEEVGDDEHDHRDRGGHDPGDAAHLLHQRRRAPGRGIGALGAHGVGQGIGFSWTLQIS